MDPESAAGRLECGRTNCRRRGSPRGGAVIRRRDAERAGVRPPGDGGRTGRGRPRPRPRRTAARARGGTAWRRCAPCRTACARWTSRSSTTPHVPRSIRVASWTGRGAPGMHRGRWTRARATAAARWWCRVGSDGLDADRHRQLRRACAQPEAYGVYTRVSHYIDWILRQTSRRASGVRPGGR